MLNMDWPPWLLPVITTLAAVAPLLIYLYYREYHRSHASFFKLPVPNGCNFLAGHLKFLLRDDYHKQVGDSRKVFKCHQKNMQWYRVLSKSCMPACSRLFLQDEADSTIRSRTSPNFQGSQTCKHSTGMSMLHQAQIPPCMLPCKPCPPMSSMRPEQCIQVQACTTFNQYSCFCPFGPCYSLRLLESCCQLPCTRDIQRVIQVMMHASHAWEWQRHPHWLSSGTMECFTHHCLTYHTTPYHAMPCCADTCCAHTMPCHAVIC